MPGCPSNTITGLIAPRGGELHATGEFVARWISVATVLGFELSENLSSILAAAKAESRRGVEPKASGVVSALAPESESENDHWHHIYVTFDLCL